MTQHFLDALHLKHCSAGSKIHWWARTRPQNKLVESYSVHPCRNCSHLLLLEWCVSPPGRRWWGQFYWRLADLNLEGTKKTDHLQLLMLDNPINVATSWCKLANWKEGTTTRPQKAHGKQTRSFNDHMKVHKNARVKSPTCGNLLKSKPAFKRRMLVHKDKAKGETCSCDECEYKSNFLRQSNLMFGRFFMRFLFFSQKVILGICEKTWCR